jgi:hypothetical protein
LLQIIARIWRGAVGAEDADVVEVRRFGSPVPPARPVIRSSGDGADLVDVLLEDVQGVVAAGSFVP